MLTYSTNSATLQQSDQIEIVKKLMTGLKQNKC